MNTVFRRSVTMVQISIAALLPVLSFAGPPQELNNPLQVPTITGLLEGILAIVLVAAIPIVVIMLIYSGFLFVTARGNPQILETARRSLMYGIIGGVVILSGYAIIAIVQGIVDGFR